MSTVDTLTIQLDVDTKGLNTGINNVIKGIDTLRNDVTKDTQSIAGSFKGMSSGISTTLSALAPSIASITSIVGLMKTAFDFGSEAQNIGQLSDKLGISTERLSQFAQVAQDFGGNKEGVFGTLEAIQSAITQFKQFGEGSLREVSMKYGVGLSTNADQQLLNIADRMQGMGRSEQMDMASMLGIDSSMLAVLSKGRKEVEGMLNAKTEGLISKEDAERGHKLQLALGRIRNAFVNISQSALQLLLPAIEMVANGVQWVNDLFQEYKFLGTSAMVAIGTAITLALKPMLLFAVASVSAMSPFLLIGGAVALLTLAIQDLWVAWKGGDSLIVNSYNSIKKWLEGLGSIGTFLLAILEKVEGLFTAAFQLGGQAFSVISSFFGDDENKDSPSAVKEGAKAQSSSVTQNINVTAGQNGTPQSYARAVGNASHTLVDQASSGVVR